MPDNIDVAVRARRLEAGRKAADTKARMKRAEIAASKARHPSSIPGLRLQPVEADKIAETLARDLLEISTGPIQDADRIRFPGW